MYKWFVTGQGMFDKIKEIATASPDKEVCGLIAGTDLMRKVVIAEKLFQVANVSPEEAQIVHYTMHPDQMYKVLEKTTWLNKKAKDDFISVWHSHPHGVPVPSSIDLDTAEWNVVYIIYGGLLGEFKAWTLKEDRTGFEEVPIFITNGTQNIDYSKMMSGE